jgi:hypothetical protein
MKILMIKAAQSAAFIINRKVLSYKVSTIAIYLLQPYKYIDFHQYLM